jgi:hypothetical protein
MVCRWLVPAAVLLGGCATARAHSSAPAPKAAPDCSFRAATTCWTLGARVPVPVRESRDTATDRLLKQPPAVLATRRDTVAAR